MVFSLNSLADWLPTWDELVLNFGGRQFLASLAGSALLLAWPQLRTRRGFFFLSVIAAVYITGLRLPEFVALHAIIFLCGRWLARRADSEGHLTIVAVIGIGLFATFYLSVRSLLASTTHLVPLIFQMHVFLRLFSFLWDCGSGVIKAPRATEFIAWSCFPPTFFGPILKYDEFERDFSKLNHSPFSLHINARDARLFGLGVFQVLLAIVFSRFENNWLLSGHGSMAQKISCWFFFSPWKIFMTFAGLWHMLEALSGFWRITIPLNFNRPLLQSDLGAFWGNWNVSVMKIFRDYFFFNRWGFQKFPLALSALITFVLVGLWHAMTPGWFYWGVIHGVAFVIYLSYRSWRSNRFGNSSQFPMWYKALCGATTYAFVCISYILPAKLVIISEAVLKHIATLFA